MVAMADGQASSQERRLCLQVATVGRDGAIHVVAVDHSGPPPAAFVRARASVSMRAVAWASQQALVTAGTTGKQPKSTGNFFLGVTCASIKYHLSSFWALRALEVVIAEASWLYVDAVQDLFLAIHIRGADPAPPCRQPSPELAGLGSGRAVSGCGRQSFSSTSRMSARRRPGGVGPAAGRRSARAALAAGVGRHRVPPAAGAHGEPECTMAPCLS